MLEITQPVRHISTILIDWEQFLSIEWNDAVMPMYLFSSESKIIKILITNMMT